MLNHNHSIMLIKFSIDVLIYSFHISDNDKDNTNSKLDNISPYTIEPQEQSFFDIPQVHYLSM